MRHSQLAHYRRLTFQTWTGTGKIVCQGSIFSYIFLCTEFSQGQRKPNIFKNSCFFNGLVILFFLILDWICEKLLDHNPCFIKLNNVHWINARKPMALLWVTVWKWSMLWQIFHVFFLLLITDCYFCVKTTGTLLTLWRKIQQCNFKNCDEHRRLIQKLQNH